MAEEKEMIFENGGNCFCEFPIENNEGNFTYCRLKPARRFVNSYAFKGLFDCQPKFAPDYLCGTHIDEFRLLVAKAATPKLFKTEYPIIPITTLYCKLCKTEVLSNSPNNRNFIHAGICDGRLIPKE